MALGHLGQETLRTRTMRDCAIIEASMLDQLCMEKGKEK